ncbi:MAG: hypothetical protein PHH59_05250 [Methylovulum sp.]|uniref:hypothetical protein n=1 Tax=Methylovulum sp. TaxID=1916980 RepID=UPI0026019BC4|nr:hypothetical protein [Methylovulum sp.]MDD2723418.1 hypothetical protein [Methylovulum sp.]MDD5125580.1 hypothetical protein [Methylovulum sp.]
MAISMLPPRLTLEQKARLKKLDERLPIMDIARLRYSEQDSDSIKSYAFDIAEACLAGEINYFHERRQSDWRWLCENPNAIPDLRYPLIGCDEIIRVGFFESDGTVESVGTVLDELESEWDGKSEPPAFKNNDPKSRYDRFYRNNRYKDGFRDSDAFVGYRWDYAEGGRCKVDAKEFKQWLINKKDYPLPDGCLLTNWLNQMEAINNLEPNDGVQSQAPTNQTTTETDNVKGGEKKTRTRTTNLRRAIVAAVNRFGRKPSFDELWQYFQDDKDDTGYIEDYTDTRITWKDTKGKLHDTNKTTIANQLSQIKSL